jgi:hypothetical protein
MNRGELQQRIFIGLNESSANPAFWTVADVQAALDDAYEEMSDASEWYERDAVLRLLSNQQYYDLRFIVEADTFLRLRAVFNATTNRWLQPISVDDLDYRTYRQWEDVTGEPEKWLVRGLWWLRMFPMRPSDTGVVQLFYKALPPAMTRSTDEPGFPREFHEGLIEYALGDLLSQEGETKRALVHFQKYQGYQARLNEWADSRTSTDRLVRLNG